MGALLTPEDISAYGHAISLSFLHDDHVLDQYLSLVYRMRDRKPGTAVPLRGPSATTLVDVELPEWPV